MKNIKEFCEAVGPLCELCESSFYSYEIVRSLDALDFPDDLRMRIYSGDNIITCTIISAIPSFMSYSVFYDNDKGLYLMVW